VVLLNSIWTNLYLFYQIEPDDPALAAAAVLPAAGLKRQFGGFQAAPNSHGLQGLAACRCNHTLAVKFKDARFFLKTVVALQRNLGYPEYILLSI